MGTDTLRVSTLRSSIIDDNTFGNRSFNENAIDRDRIRTNPARTDRRPLCLRRGRGDESTGQSGMDCAMIDEARLRAETKSARGDASNAMAPHAARAASGGGVEAGAGRRREVGAEEGGLRRDKPNT